MIEYPKIETLYNRDEKFKVVPGVLRYPEFAVPRRWVVTEKIDGTNIRVGMTADGRVSFAGRTDNAQIPPHLLAYLAAAFTRDRMAAAFAPETEVVLFGEGYGAKIQKDGGLYRPDVGFILFDVLIDGWWLEPENIIDVAVKLGIEHAPYIHIAAADVVSASYTAAALRELLDGGMSVVAASRGLERPAEGIVARTSPMLFDRRGRRVMWKLKFRDFGEEA